MSKNSRGVKLNLAAMICFKKYEDLFILVWNYLVNKRKVPVDVMVNEFLEIKDNVYSHIKVRCPISIILYRQSYHI